MRFSSFSLLFAFSAFSASAVSSALAAGCSSNADPSDDVEDEGALQGADIDVIFSPQAPDKAHTVKIAQLIRGAQHTLDVAMYSFSEAEISRALEDAVTRGVKVRMVFETAGEDTRLTGSAKSDSKSGRLEAKGIDVRYVNKIMHHKFVIADGPRDDASRASTAKIASGSANWSTSAATKYDENTLFFSKIPELALRLQREFNGMWEHSRDFALATPIAQERASLDITDEAIPNDSSVDGLFTSKNFKVNDTTFSTNGNNTVADALVAAIKAAQSSIHISSGHLRSRPVALALMDKKRESPNVDIKVYLDAQEYISVSGHDEQQQKLDTCLSAAGDNESKKRACTDKGFLYGYAVGKAGIDVRYKFYSYRWDASYAKQMHNKFFLFDKKTLFTGSYNLSDNAEHETFENVLVFKGTKFRSLVRSYEDTFGKIWETGRGDTQPRVQDAIRTADPIPLVFDPLALTHDEVTSLKRLIRDNCPAADSVPFRQNAAGHQTCPRNGGPVAPPNGDAPADPPADETDQ